MAAIAQPNPMSGALLSLAAPDYQIQQLRAQRAYALAQALQQQALEPIDGHGGAISWTQGLAKIADALVGAGANRRADRQMIAANQALANGLKGLFGAGQVPGGSATAAAPAQTPTPAAFVPGQAPAPGQPDPLAPLPDAPPQAASTPPSAPPPAPTGGASPMSLTGDPNRDLALYMMNPDAYTQQLATVAGKGATPTDMEVTVAHARQALRNGDIPTATALLGSVQKNNYIAPVSVRPGAPLYDPVQHKVIFQAARVGEGQGADYQTNPQTGQIEPTRVYNIPGATEAAAAQAGAVAGAQAGAKAPFDTITTYNPQTGQMEVRPKSDVTGGGHSLNSYYGVGGSGAPQAAGGHALPAGPSLGQTSAFDAYGKGSANAFLNTQEISKESPQRVQALREMQTLIAGPNALSTGPTAARLQHLAEEHGLPFGYSNNAFVFNKDAARFVAQSASDLGLNGSDARLGMMANASPNMKMTPEALKVVIPTMIGLEYAKMAKATAAANFAQHNPAGNAQFESQWRQAYDPRMFTAYAEGGAKALAQAPAKLRQQWLKDYRTLKGMGVDFTQFAQ
jgi:hypothetical protein